MPLGALANYTTYPPVAAFSATPTFDFSTGDMQTMAAMTANVTSMTFVNASVGQICSLLLQQDGTGGRTVTFPANVRGTPPAPAAGANAYTAYRFRYDGSNFWYNA